ncbi:hypothetical protein [Pseudonocardia sp. NPDC049154]|uniref:hypothetical protein n=1 Tax=Pseudonocardia sp. NPDC049154 TaxID=3155501 RepID=UPI00340EA498
MDLVRRCIDLNRSDVEPAAQLAALDQAAAALRYFQADEARAPLLVVCEILTDLCANGSPAATQQALARARAELVELAWPIGLERRAGSSPWVR